LLGHLGIPGSDRSLTSVRVMASAIDALYAACFIVIAYLVGARASEILRLKVGCVKRLGADRDPMTFIVGAIFKKEPEYHGRPHEWVAPPPAVQAVTLLEALSEGHRRQTGRDDLWLRRCGNAGAREWRRRCAGELRVLSTPLMGASLTRAFSRTPARPVTRALPSTRAMSNTRAAGPTNAVSATLAVSATQPPTEPSGLRCRRAGTGPAPKSNVASAMGGRSCGMRQEVARNIRENRPTDRLSEYPFRKFLRTVYSETGQELMNLVHPRRTKSLAEQWARCPERFPYYSAFIEGLLYSAYYAAVRHNDPIDENAQADYEQLAYLAWADIVVSNDRRFFLRAFEEIWKPRGKRLETAESFSEFVNRIA